MTKRLLLLAFSFAAGLAAPAAAQEPTLQWDGRELRAPMLTLGLKPADALFPIGLAQAQRPSFTQRPRFADWLATWNSNLRGQLAASVTTPGDSAVATSSDSVTFLPPPPIRLTNAARDTTGEDGGILASALGDHADIGMLIQGRGELGGAWNRYTPCDPGLQLTCTPSLFPQLKPDVQFGVRVGGTISDRIHVNVDYDQTREFDAANNINVYYEGFEDEILRRLEVGDVSIRLPPSRYLTQGIPTGNFGFKATGQLGPIDFQTVWAQQRGDVTTRQFRLGGTGNMQGLVQDETLQIDDGDYVKGQFFFLTDPDNIVGAPHIDVLTLRTSDVVASERPAAGAVIEVYRDERPSALNQQQQAQLGYFLADAVMPDQSRKHTGLFKRLEQGKDYFVHSSGLWIMLRSPLRQDEALAVSYITEDGDTVGTAGAERVPAGTVPSLLMLRGPASIHQPNFPTWKYEMHNVYRVHSSSSVDVSSVQLTITLGQMSAGRTFANTPAGPLPYIKLLGLDEDAPENALDPAQVFQPQEFGGFSQSGQRITGTYVMLPTLRPFFEPAPVASARLSALDAKLALGTNANRTIYEDVDPVSREAGGRFRLNFSYRVKVEGLISSFNLGAFGLREGSDKIVIGATELKRDIDYTIDYDIGTVTLLDPQSLFATNPGSEIRATWEQKSQFQIAPTSVFGMNAHYQLGARGELNFVGLYQSEKTIMSRPQLGVEPSAIFLGGSSARLDLGGSLIDRALSKLPGLRLGGTSSLIVNGEAAMSMPNPNTRDEAYLDDFEGADGTPLSLQRRNWRLGSRPGTLEGTSGYLPGLLVPDNAAQLVWQHDLLNRDGNPIGGAYPSEIDQQIQVAGSPVKEAAMWLTLGDTANPKSGQRWRSMTTALSTTGTDLSRSEYLEFYVWSSGAKGQALIFDIGTVSEDAYYFDEGGRLNGFYPDNTPWGLGILDAEARLALREIWDTQKDARGLYAQSCTGVGNQVPPLGDISANCARGNGLLDTEDLDGNGLLDNANDDAPYFRYTVPLDALSPYLVRDRSQTGTLYQLYRVPLRDGLSVNGASVSTWRFIKHLRMTVTSNSAQAADNLVITRARIVGSRWVKRDVEGVNRGLLSDEKGLSAASAAIQVGPVSRLTNAGEYVSPPQVREQLQDPSRAIGATGEEFNEKGLSVRYNGVGSDERAEIYFRYPQQPRSFLSYRQMQLWALAKTGNFGEGGDQRLIVKVGTDARNYYLYQSKLNAPVGERAITQNDWLPQITIDFKEWFELKAKAELALLQGATAEPGKPFVFFSADSTYAIVLEDRSRAPNLAAVRELSFGIYNGGTNISQGEIWLNDVRLGAAFRDPGAAGNLSIDLRGGDFLTANVTFANQGSVFRQLNQDASYLGAGELTLATTAQLGQMMPASWGLDMPISIVHSKSAQDPTLLEASDVEAARLPGLRDIGSGLTRVGLSVRKRTPSANPIVSALVDGMSVRLGYNTGTSSAITMRHEASGFDGAVNYMRDVKSLDVDIMPGFMEAALRFLAPAAFENSTLFQRVVGARLRYTPKRVAFSTTYFGQERRAFQYNTILASGSDAAIVPIESPRRTLDADAVVSMAPFASLTGDVSLRTSRDLLPSERATTRTFERNALEKARSGLAGVDLGWETNRSLTTTLNFRPTIAGWVKPSTTVSTRFGTDRSPSYLEIVTVGADTNAILQRRFQADRQARTQLEFQPLTFFRTFVHDTTGFTGVIDRLLRNVQPLMFSWNTSLGSQFDRRTIDPSLHYQLALGDLERFRYLGVDSAASATETGRFEVASSVRLPRNAQIDLHYATSDLQAFDQHGGNRTEHQTVWPNVRLNLADVPLPGFMRGLIPQLGMSGSYQFKQRDQALGIANNDRGSEEQSVPFTVRATLPGGLTAMYSGNWTSGSSTDPTGDAEQDGMSHNLNMAITMKPPQALGDKLKEPIRANVSLTQNAQRQCRFRTTTLPGFEEGGCVSYIDFQNRAVNLTIDTNVSDLIVGLQMGYTSRQDYVGSRRGNSQFQLGIFANFELPVGQLPGGQFQGGGGGIR